MVHPCKTDMLIALQETNVGIPIDATSVQIKRLYNQTFRVDIPAASTIDEHSRDEDDDGSDAADNQSELDNNVNTGVNVTDGSIIDCDADAHQNANNTNVAADFSVMRNFRQSSTAASAEMHNTA